MQKVGSEMIKIASYLAVGSCLTDKKLFPNKQGEICGTYNRLCCRFLAWGNGVGLSRFFGQRGEEADAREDREVR